MPNKPWSTNVKINGYVYAFTTIFLQVKQIYKLTHTHTQTQTHTQIRIHSQTMFNDWDFEVQGERKIETNKI